jgi:PD-(D/E)XK endonuclease
MERRSGGRRSGERESQLEAFHQALPVIAAGSRRGDAAEAEFIARACALNWRIAKPWGNIDPYEVLVGMGYGFCRVQVKCAYQVRRSEYQTRTSGGGVVYTKEQIDFLAGG